MINVQKFFPRLIKIDFQKALMSANFSLAQNLVFFLYGRKKATLPPLLDGYEVPCMVESIPHADDAGHFLAWRQSLAIQVLVDHIVSCSGIVMEIQAVASVGLNVGLEISLLDVGEVLRHGCGN